MFCFTYIILFILPDSLTGGYQRMMTTVDHFVLQLIAIRWNYLQGFKLCIIVVLLLCLILSLIITIGVDHWSFIKTTNNRPLTTFAPTHRPTDRKLYILYSLIQFYLLIWSFNFRKPIYVFRRIIKYCTVLWVHITQEILIIFLII